MKKWTSVNQFGHDALGPVMNVFMTRLHSYLLQCNDSNHKILFAMRAGLRIQDLYQTWLAARNIEPPANMALLKASRMMAIKAAYAAEPTLSVTALGRELVGSSLNDIVHSVLNRDMALGRCPELPHVPQAPLHEFLKQDNQVASFVRRYLNRQSELYTAYLNNLAGDAKRLILVDSGWRGTTQLLFEAAFPNYEWEGIYFGCIGRSEIFGRRPGPMHGLMFDSELFRPEKPETAFLVHRHLIESLFEPGVPSVEQIEAEDIGVPFKIEDLTKDELRESWDDAYEGVRTYLKTHGADSLAKITADYQLAIERLAEVVCHPTQNDVLYACGKMRSHDLGRVGEVTSVMPAKDRFDGDNPSLRVKEAIWQTGQAVLEFTEDQAKVQQDKIISSLIEEKTGHYFVAPTDAVVSSDEAQAGHVAIITRTKDRPLLLQRAAESVASQSHNNYSWVIVNDGGSLEDVQKVLKEALVDPEKIIICSNSQSLGMEAASNVGIKASESDYIVIHDDDDSWHPDFLKESVQFLNQNRLVYSGVVTKTLYVSEEIQGQSVIEHGRWPYQDWVQNVQLSEMVIGNYYAPIAFVFRREVWEALGGFDEQLPVLGDWDFNLRFLMKADIGVLPKYLAYYHHRDRNSSNSTYSNSVIGGMDRHAAYNAIVRNKYIRLAGTDSEYSALGTLMASGFAQQDTRHRLAVATDQICQSISHQPSREIIVKNETPEEKEKPTQLQAELDRRWIMLHMLASEFVKAKGINKDIPELLQQVSSLTDEYAKATPLDSPPDFDEADYLKLNKDIAPSLKRGIIKSGFDHYIKHGISEGRKRALNKQTA